LIGAIKTDLLDLMKNNNSVIKLQAYYLFPKFNFPECREQFAFKFDYSDIILFGGLSSNKNVSVWTLDLGNYSQYNINLY